ncbi:MAG: hypothetical protein ACK2UB_01220, partial [Anaerolineales bacterium]
MEKSFPLNSALYRMNRAVSAPHSTAKEIPCQLARRNSSIGEVAPAIITGIPSCPRPMSPARRCSIAAERKGRMPSTRLRIRYWRIVS